MLAAAAGLALLLPFSAVTPCLAEEQETIKVESSEAAQPLNGDISSSDDRISNEGANNQQQPEESLSVADAASNSSSNNTTVWHSGWNGPDDNGNYRWEITDDELAKNTWLFINNHWYWFDSNGTMARGLVNVAGKNYFFTESGNYAGAMATDWARADDGSWYWADASGALAGAGWRFIGGSWYWFGEDSRMATGWLETGSARYHLEPSGAMATNWAAVDGSWYWFGASGAMETGWLYEGGSWYWLDPSDGRMAVGLRSIGGMEYSFCSSGMMQVGWGLDSNSKWIYASTSGSLQTGWQYVNGSWYWLDQQTYEMATGLLDQGVARYFLTDSGAMATDWARADDGSWYWADASGALAGAGWRFIGGSWYWFGEDSRMATGWLETGSARYHLEPSGAMATNWAAVDGSWYWFGASGAMETGWLYEGGSWYWLDPSDGRMANDTWYDDGARSYWLGSTGAMARSIWVKFDCLWYWIGNDGSSVCGWEDLPAGRFFFTKQSESTRYPAEFGLIDINNKYYYIDENSGLLTRTWVPLDNGSMAFADANGIVDKSVTRVGNVLYINGTVANGWIQIDGVWFHTDANGVLSNGWIFDNDSSKYYYLTNGLMETGWILDSGIWYYLNPDGSMATGWKNLDGAWYYLEDSGAMHIGWLNWGNGWYYLGESGAMLTGNHVIDGYYRRFNSSGSCDKVGYQNPTGYFQVSSWNVAPARLGAGDFSYVTPSRIGVNASRSDCVETFINRAYEYLSTPYIWDYACAPGVGVDCAGLVIQCLYATGMDISPMNPYDHYYTPGHDHYANDMWDNNQFLHLGIGDRQRGDIVCWPGHVAIYLGDDQIIEAYSPRVGVRITGMYNWGTVRGVLRPFI